MDDEVMFANVKVPVPKSMVRNFRNQCANQSLEFTLEESVLLDEFHSPQTIQEAMQEAMQKVLQSEKEIKEMVRKEFRKMEKELIEDIIKQKEKRPPE